MVFAPIHKLKHEHRVIEQVLRALEGVCFQLACKQPIPSQALSEIVDFTSRFVDTYHHAKEETGLFPRLEKHGIARQGGALGSIEHEHRLERRLIDDLNVTIEGLEAGSELSRHTFIDAARKFITHLTNHMQQEEAILFRLANELFDASDGEAIAAEFRHIETEFGEENLKRYENLAMALEEKWAL